MRGHTCGYLAVDVHPPGADNWHVEFDFDSAKDAINRAKHGLSLGDAERLDWENARLYPDLRRDYGEARMIALVPMGKRVHSVVFVDRDGKRRIISLRKAHFKEVRRYELSRH